MRFVRRLRASLPDRRAGREIDARKRHGRSLRDHHLRLLRRRMFVQGGSEGRRSRPHAAEQGRDAESRPLLRQGTLRVGLRDSSGPRARAHGAREDQRRVAHGVVGRGNRLRGETPERNPDQVWRRRDRRHHFVALHQRGNLPGAKDGARRLRQQQRRYLRARLSFAHRLRPQDHAWNLGRHPGLRLRAEGRRDPGDRMQPDRRPSGVRLADEAAAASRREADRRRSAHDRSRTHAAYRSHVPSAAPAGHQRRADQCIRPRGAERRAGQRRFRARALRVARVRVVEEIHSRGAQLARSRRESDRRAGGENSRRRPLVRDRRQRGHLLRPRRDRA